MATGQESPLRLSERALVGATNDEALELAYRLFENLAERAEVAADLAIDSDDRDVENEALVFARASRDVMPTLSSHPRTTEAWSKTAAAKDDIEILARNRRARLDGSTTRLEQFSSRRQRRLQGAWEVERRRTEKQATALLERASITPERVLEAAAHVASEVRGEFRAVDVAVALMPELANTSLVGRQRVVNHVATTMRKLAAAGRLAQVRPANSNGGRATCRYRIEGGKSDAI